MAITDAVRLVRDPSVTTSLHEAAQAAECLHDRGGDAERGQQGPRISSHERRSHDRRAATDDAAVVTIRTEKHRRAFDELRPERRAKNRGRADKTCGNQRRIAAEHADDENPKERSGRRPHAVAEKPDSAEVPLTP